MDKAEYKHMKRALPREA